MELEVHFEDPETGDVVREVMEVNLSKTEKERVQKKEVTIEPQPDHLLYGGGEQVRGDEGEVPQVMLPSRMSVAEVRRAVNAIATKLYRPPWK